MGELFGTLVGWMTDLLNGLYHLTDLVGVPNYGLAIIILTILIKVLLYPLNYKQMQSMVVLQRLQPKIKELQEKYKKDPQKMQQKMLELYRENGANPMMGCLPLLIQLPIIIALYRGLLHLLRSVEAEKLRFLWVANLGQSGVHAPQDLLLPLMAGVTTYWQMKVTPTTGGQEQMQRMMSLMMPAVIVYVAVTLPSGLALYWVVFNVLSVVQQYYINRRLLELKEDNQNARNG